MDRKNLVTQYRARARLLIIIPLLQLIFQLKSYLWVLFVWSDILLKLNLYFRSPLQNKRNICSFLYRFPYSVRKKKKIQEIKNCALMNCVAAQYLVNNIQCLFIAVSQNLEKSEENVCISKQLKKSWIAVHRRWHIFNGYIAHGQRSEGSAPHVKYS